MLRVLLAVLGCLLLVWIVTGAVRPFMVARRMQEEYVQSQRRVAALKQETQALRRSVESMETPEGLESEARRGGWVRPGEVPIVFTQ